MAKLKQNFTRSNVNESTLQISAPNRSSFDMSHRVKGTFKLGVLHPVNIEYLTPTDMLKGSLTPNLQLEKVVTPELGRLRLDTHTMVVMARRINSGWRQFAESSRDFQNVISKPTFKPNVLFGEIFAFLMSGDVSYKPYDSTFTSLEFTSATISDLNVDMVNLAISTYQALLSFGDDYGYLKDFFSLEVARLSSYVTIITGDTHVSFAQALDTVMQPYFGIGSIFDSIGYPIFHQYSRVYSSLDYADVDGDAAFLTELFDLGFDEFLSIVDFSQTESGEFTVDYNMYGLMDEMPLRAIYAAWYDYLRNFHVEKRSNCLDPDLFGSSPCLDLSSDIYTYYNICQLLLPKYRMYSRDALTTVQEDDVYRHVYAPIYDGSSGEVYYDSVGSDPDDVVQKALAITLDKGTGVFSGLQVPFMGDLFNRTASNGSVTSVYMQDLQTMRRASMLEKYLARDFYNPDTYAGYIRARYSIVPDDINFLCSEYIGGDEVMIDGEQQISNVSTDVMPAGSRTFTGGGSLSDSFSYRASDFGYVVSFVSLVPQVAYNAANMHAHELTPFDLPLPEFASDTRVLVKASDIVRGLEADTNPLGFVPRYYGYRARLDELHGKYLTDKRSWDWTRDWYNMFFTNVLSSEDLIGFALNPYCLRVHLPLDSFLGLNQWDDIAYGSTDIQMVIDRPLPAAVEFI